MTTQNAAAALASGAVDAAAIYEPYLSTAEKQRKGSKVVISSKQIPGMIVDLIFVRDEVATSREADIKKVIEGWRKAMTFIQQQPEEAYSIMANAFNLPVNEFKDVVSGIQWLDLPDNRRLFGTDAEPGGLYRNFVVVRDVLRHNRSSVYLAQPEDHLTRARDGDYSELQLRRAAILDAVQQQFAERYTPEMIAQAKAESLEFLFVSEREAEKPLDVMSRHFQSLAASQARGLTDLKFGQAQSTRVYLTLDPALQAAAYKAVIEHRQHLDRLVADARRKQGLTAESAEQIQMALVAIEVQTGQILALVGSRGEGEFFNYATAKRSPGSAIKPFVYLAALDGGSLGGAPFTAASIIHPLTDAVDNYRPDSHPGEIASARRNLAISGNAAACVVSHCAGLARTRNYVERFTGAHSNELTGMLTIGGSAGSEVDAVGFTAGYAALASGGLKYLHLSLRRWEGSDPNALCTGSHSRPRPDLHSHADASFRPAARRDRERRIGAG